MDEQIQSKTREMALLFSAINNLQVCHYTALTLTFGVKYLLKTINVNGGKDHDPTIYFALTLLNVESCRRVGCALFNNYQCCSSLLQVTYNEDAAVANVLEDDVEELVEEGEEATG